jgi:serine/threonine-protein kinase
VGAFGIAVVNMWGVFPEPGAFGTWLEIATSKNSVIGIPWECVWIIIFPLIAPNTPGKTFLASIAAASVGPLTLALSKAAGATSPDVPLGTFMAFYLTSTYLCAGLAFVISRGVHKFGRRLTKAREVGSYRLAERLGLGGMGEVWLAEHRMLARPAAIKLIRPEALGEDDASRRSVMRRFEREAQATAALRSTHTIELYDFGVTDEGAFYYVMELLDGLNLKELVQRFGPVPASRAVHLLRQVCHSLGEAHDRGMIHRDIKPANIFVCRLGPDLDFVKVLDFGLVKARHDLGPAATELTMEGVVAGTPTFMAPEMAAGPEIDGRADIYALGCVGYWLLTGQPVFEGDTALATVLQHVQSEPVPPSVRTELEVPEALEKVILACLAKDPAGRPQTAGDLDDALAACDAGWGRERAEDWWQLHLAQNGASEGLQVRPGRP